MFNSNCKHVYIDSGYFRTLNNQYIIKTGIVVVEPHLPNDYFIASRFARSGLDTKHVEMVGIRLAFEMFNHLNVKYFNDNQYVISHKNKLFPSELCHVLSWKSRWEREMMIADSIVKQGIKNRINIPNDKQWVTVIRFSHKKYTVATYQYGTLFCIDTSVSKKSIKNLRKNHPEIILLNEIFEPHFK